VVRSLSSPVYVRLAYDRRTVCYALRERLIPLLPLRLQSHVKHYAPLASFDAALEAGYSSSNFDLRGNLQEADARSGLDDEGLAQVRRLMCVRPDRRLASPSAELARTGTGIGSTLTRCGDVWRSYRSSSLTHAHRRASCGSSASALWTLGGPHNLTAYRQHFRANGIDPNTGLPLDKKVRSHSVSRAPP
jgi:hypothetical protein